MNRIPRFRRRLGSFSYVKQVLSSFHSGSRSLRSCQASARAFALPGIPLTLKGYIGLPSTLEALTLLIDAQQASFSVPLDIQALPAALPFWKTRARVGLPSCLLADLCADCVSGCYPSRGDGCDCIGLDVVSFQACRATEVIASGSLAGMEIRRSGLTTSRSFDCTSWEKTWRFPTRSPHGWLAVCEEQHDEWALR